MKQCPYCHRGVEDDATHCPYCYAGLPNDGKQEKTKQGEMKSEETRSSKRKLRS